METCFSLKRNIPRKNIFFYENMVNVEIRGYALGFAAKKIRCSLGGLQYRVAKNRVDHFLVNNRPFLYGWEIAKERARKLEKKAAAYKMEIFLDNKDNPVKFIAYTEEEVSHWINKSNITVSVTQIKVSPKKIGFCKERIPEVLELENETVLAIYVDPETLKRKVSSYCHNRKLETESLWLSIDEWKEYKESKLQETRS